MPEHFPARRQRSCRPWLLAAATVLALAGCAERDQAASGIASDTEAFQGTSRPYVDPGWKQGDRASWEQHLKTRTVYQNDYATMP